MTAFGSSSAFPIGASTTVTLSDGGGIVFVPASAPLIGLNYYDGRFLRADDLNLERQGQRAYVEYSNQAGGQGLVYGFDVTWQGTQLSLSAGLAVDPKGRLLYLPDAVNADIADLVKASQPAGGASAQAAATSSAGFGPCAQATVTAGASTPVVGGTELYLVCVSHAQGLCGQGEVFGRVCDDVCVTATDRPYVVDGVALSLLPLKLQHPFPTLAGVTRPEVHLRSQVASAFFADEWDQGRSLLSASGLRTRVWCAGAALVTAGDAVPVGVLGWDGKAVTLLDEWTARRERIETPPRAYWAGRMELRPWPVFLAQVLQFQCQLADLGQPAPASTRVLLDGGLVELPSAGYLPVDIASGTALRKQLQGLLGDGVNLRFCAVRRDQIAHELERAQHMNRISLIRGLSNRADQELVDILVPDGVLEADTAITDLGLTVDLAVGPDASSDTPPAQPSADLRRLLVQGVGRVNLEGGLSVAAAVAGSSSAGLPDLAALIAHLARSGANLGQALGELHRMPFHSDVPAAGLLQNVGDLVIKRGIAQRTAGSPAPVVSVPDPGAPVVAISVSGWVAQDPFAMADGAYAAFHLGVDLIVLADEDTTTVKFSADGRLQRLSGQPWGVGYQVGISVTGFAQSSVTSRGSTDTSSGQFTQTMVLRRGKQGGDNVLGLSDAQTTWMIGVGWHGDSVQAAGGLMLIADGQDPTAPGAVEDAFALALGGISHRPSPAPGRYDVIAAVDAAQDAAINQPGDPHREAAIAALEILSALYPKDVTYIERGYGELFPPAAALPSHVRPTTDWVLFRRRRLEDCEGIIELPLAAPSKVAAWVARAETVDQAKSWTAELFDSGGVKIPWKAVSGDALEFEAGAATLLTAPSVWRDQYQQVGGGESVHSAGYAPTPGGSDVPVGVGRTRALLDATAPVATLDPDGRVDLVGVPPANQMLAGTDGSIFLITYQPDLVDVITVDAMENEGLAAAIRDTPDVQTVTQAGASVSLLASVDATGGLTPPAAELRSKLDERKTEIAGQHGNQVVFVSAVIWMAQSLSGERKTQSQDHANSVLAGLDLSAGSQHDVDFQPGTGAPVRVYVLFESQQLQ
jgi:hypothetical protein